MKSRETLIRLKKFQVDEKRRRVAQIEGMIAEFERMAFELEREIKTEQDRAGIHDPGHFAYPTYAKAAIQRRENLTRSAGQLQTQLDDANQASLGEAFEELKKVELLDERDQMPGTGRRSPRNRAGRTQQHRPDAGTAVCRVTQAPSRAAKLAPPTKKSRAHKAREVGTNFKIQRMVDWSWLVQYDRPGRP